MSLIFTFFSGNIKFLLLRSGFFPDDVVVKLKTETAFLITVSLVLFTLLILVSAILMKRIVKDRTSELEEAKKKAEESDRLKSAFLSNMSHEIRTPLNGIIGFAELLTMESLNNEKRIPYAEIVLNSSQQLLNVVNDILDISKLETGQMTIYYSMVVIEKLFNQH